MKVVCANTDAEVVDYGFTKAVRDVMADLLLFVQETAPEKDIPVMAANQ